MWWHCRYEAHDRISPAQLTERFLRQHDAGSNAPSKIRGWYTFASGISGYVVFETDTLKELTEIIAPFACLVTWRVESITELHYTMFLEEARQHHHQRSSEITRV
ncbi:DUF3303 family protein [Rhodococcus sp. 5A-K4]|uniref:DUF3303 family protein n=1 Tax=Rhodococcus TaxID=1827 RepID=UPI00355AF590